MVPLLRAELRKLFTVRSTYVLSAVTLLLAGFISFWVLGYKGQAANPGMVMEAVRTSAMAASVFVAIAGILLVTHEYRYNTIMYTLTASNSRSKVLLAKLAVMVAYTLAFSILVTGFAALLTLLGLHMGHETVAPQQFYYWDTMWRTLFYVLGYVLIGMVFALLFRHVVGAIATFLVVPTTVEGLLSLLLKENTKYLPYTSLDQVLSGMLLTPPKAALIVSVYLVVGWAVSWMLFMKRDAN